MLKEIIGIFKKSEDGDETASRWNRLNLFYLLSALTILLYLAFAIHTLIAGVRFLFVLNSVTLLLLILNLLYGYRIKKSELPATILSTVVGLQFLVLFVHGGIEQSGLLFTLVYPTGIMLLLGLKRGSLFGILFFSVIVVTMVIPDSFIAASKYPLQFEVRYIASYMVLFMLTLIYEYVRKRSVSNLEQSIYDINVSKKSRDDFISKLSHQIRTPLNNIVVLGNILSEAKPGEKQTDLLETLIASANNLVNIVNNISKVSSIETEEKVQEEIIFDIRGTIENTMEFIKKRDPDRLKAEIKTTENIPKKLVGAPIQIRQILLNTVESILSLEGMGPVFTSIDMSVSHQEGTLCSIQLKITPKKSTGIEGGGEVLLKEEDLKNVKKLVEKSGGRFQLDKVENQSIVYITLRFKKPEAGEEKKEARSLSHLKLVPRTEKIDLKQGNVLLVEDNLINQKIVLLSLKKHVKNIDVANNGKEALDKFGTTNYDIILMDIQMPIMDGLIATKKIRELEESTNSHIPIIAITANALLGDKETCLNAGMDEYISKPFQIEELVTKMTHLLASEPKDMEAAI